eukprot:jgi/Chlat1/971/Chrsp108S01435
MANRAGKYLAQVASAVDSLDGASLARLLRVDGAESRAALAEALRVNPKLNIALLCEQRLREPYDEMLASHCQCLVAVEQRRYTEAYAALVASTQAFLKEFRQTESAYCIKPLHALADEEQRTAGKKAEKLTDAGSQLMKCFSMSLQAQHNKQKKMATLHIVNQLFKIYFKLNTLRLCNNLIKAVEAPTFGDFNAFPIAQKVTYKFYVGRLSVFHDNYPKANAELSYAFQRCHRRSLRNKRLILQYLVPVKLLLGQLPNSRLLAKYNLPEYEDVASAVRNGNVRQLNTTLNDQQQRHLSHPGEAEVFRLPHAVEKDLSYSAAARASQSSPAAHIAIECILANLIYKKYVKGYISHKNRVVVLSKQQAFPALSSVSPTDS